MDVTSGESDVRLKRTNRGNQRRSSRLASTSPARALNRSFYIESDNEDADASLIVISRPKKKRYSSQANQVLSPSKPTNDNSLSKAIVTTTTNLKCDRKPIKSSNDMNDVANQQLTSVQNFKMFRKPSFVLKKTASLESLENANVTVILTSPEAISAAIDPKQVKSESGGKKTQKLKAKKKEEQKISDFFEKSPPKMIGLDENSELDASVIAIEPDRVVLEMNSLQKPVRMVDFSEMFKMANSNITDRNDTTDRTTDFVKKTRKKRTKPTIKSKSKLQPSQESIVANKPEVLTIDNEATVISSTVIELLDIINDDDETIIYGSGVSRGELESTQSLPKPANSCIYEPDNVWTAKHAPKSIAETVCSAQLSEFIKNWILDYENKYDVNDDTSSQNSNSEVYEEEVNEDAQKELCLLISGPIGCGKTSLVYAIAKEINHKVFELNCSTRRNSKVINKLKEVTLSHTVSRKEDVGTFLEGAKSSKDMFLKNFLKGRSSITPAGSNGTTKDQPQSITKFFIQPNSKSKSEYQMGDSESLLLNGFTCESNSQSSALCLNANSIILIDDVDVIFEDDAGFWSALNQLIETSRKPVILTATYGIEQLKTLVKHMNTIRIDAPHYPLIEKQLLRLVHKELDNPNYRIQNDFKKDLLSNDDFVTKLQLIVKQCCQTNGDVRKSINLLQFEITAFLFGKLGLQDESNSKKLTTTNETGGDRSLNKLNLLDIERMSIADILGEQFSLNEMNDYDFTIRHEPNFSSKSLSTDIVNKLRVQKDSQIQIQEPGYLIEMKKQNHSESIQNVIDALSLWPNHGASLSLDYFPYLSFICLSERERYDLYSSNTRKSRRYMHYLDSVSILLSKECKAFFLHYLESPTVSCY